MSKRDFANKSMRLKKLITELLCIVLFVKTHGIGRTMLKDLSSEGKFVIRMTNYLTTYLNGEEIQQLENFEILF